MPSTTSAPEAPPQERVFGNSVHVRVIPVKPRGLVGGKCNVVLESLAGIDKGLDDLIGVACGGRVGAVVVNVERGKRHLGSARPAVRRIDGHGERLRRGIVGDRNDQVIARLHVERRVFQAARCHEAKQSSVRKVGSRLIRELDCEHSVLTEQRRRLMYNTSRGEARTGIGNRLNRGSCADRSGRNLREHGHLCDNQEHEAKGDPYTNVQPRFSEHGITSGIRLG